MQKKPASSADKVKNLSKKNIPWHHARWFWGLVVGVMVVLNILSYYLVASKTNTTGVRWYFISLARGFDITFRQIFTDSNYTLFSVFFYVILLALLYKSFDQRRVKLRYPIILVLIILASTLGIFAAGIAS